ncbi:hypothetical protein [Salinispora vitiensis]|uniref:hypothetical protein n=1 Tax=Salinispora vitiensis TaxID=999544 RepID=UPI001CC3D20A|nr:hypothetical protein [Salinispora vitiensis]
MADDSSRRRIQNAFSLIYGLKLPSDIYATYAFAPRLQNAGRTLPKVHVIAKNRLTQYMGPASAYAAVLRSITVDVKKLMASHSEISRSTTSTTAWSTSGTSRRPGWWRSRAGARSTPSTPGSWMSWDTA